MTLVKLKQEKRSMTLKEIRLKAGDTPVTLGGKLGVHPGTVYDWEAGRKSPRADHLIALAEEYGPEVYDIFRNRQEAV